MRILLLVTLGSLGGINLAAQTPAVASRDRIDTPHLTIATSASAPAGPGAPVSLRIDIAPKPKMHVYAPDKAQPYIPVSLSLKASSAFKAHDPKFPPPEKYFFEALKETQLVYSKPFQIVQDVTPVQKPGAGPLTITGTLRYQACDDKVCYPPRNVPVSWVVAMK
jgi:DsbC/DsbD-like thiol-disulfide interchange protein